MHQAAPEVVHGDSCMHEGGIRNARSRRRSITFCLLHHIILHTVLASRRMVLNKYKVCSVKLPFTITSLNQNNALGTANVAITVPAAPIFSETNLVPGESAGPEDLVVTNEGSTDARYFIFADWRPGPNTSPAGACGSRPGH